MPISLKDTSVLIVGASSGMGRETALLFAREGARVMAAARREDRLRELTDHGISVFPADAGDPEAMQALTAATVSKFGRIDIMIYATGTNTPDRDLKRLTPPVWDMMIEVNLSGAFYATHAVLPGMRERKAGQIIYLSSKSALVPDESGASYQAAKHGLTGLARAVRFEEKDNGIRTCVVHPGFTDTEILSKRRVQPSPEVLAKALRPEDIAELVLAVAKLPPRAWVPEVHLFPNWV